jgi:hypothetical protein
MDPTDVAEGLVKNIKLFYDKNALSCFSLFRKSLLETDENLHSENKIELGKETFKHVAQLGCPAHVPLWLQDNIPSGHKNT